MTRNGFRAFFLHCVYILRRSRPPWQGKSDSPRGNTGRGHGGGRRGGRGSKKSSTSNEAAEEPQTKVPFEKPKPRETPARSPEQAAKKEEPARNPNNSKAKSKPETPVPPVSGQSKVILCPNQRALLSCVED